MRRPSFSARRIQAFWEKHEHDAVQNDDTKMETTLGRRDREGREERERRGERESQIMFVNCIKISHFEIPLSPNICLYKTSDGCEKL